MYLELSLVFLSLAVFLIVVFTVPLLIQVQRIARGVAETQAIIQKSLPGILANLEEASLNMRNVSSLVHVHVENFAVLVARLQAVLGVLRELESILGLRFRIPFYRTAKALFALAKGIHVFVKVFASPRQMK